MSRRRGPVTKNIKDYLVPIIGWILILFLLISMFTGWDDQADIQKENQLGISVMMDTSNTESFVIYPGQDKVEITENISLFKWEQLIVKEWSLSLDIPELWNARLGKLWEIKFNEDGTFTHTSGKVWFNSNGNIDVHTRFASVKMWENSHVSFDQNEMASTIYALSGMIEVVNLAGQNTLLLPGEKISISRMDANNSDVDLKSFKEDIDDLFKNDEWYKINNWDKYLNKEITEDEDSSDTESTTISNSTRVLVFDNIEDEANISAGSLNITGRFGDESIVKVTLNGQEAEVNIANKTFSFNNIDTSSQENDLVFRAIDDAGDILEKKLITLYYNWGNTTTSWNQLWDAKNYDNVDASQFTFTAPSKFTTFTTTGNQVTIQGQVFNKNVATVTVNGYQLNSYSAVNGTWKYHAFSIYNNLSDGTNVYEVKYYDINSKLIYTNNYTIVKSSEQFIKKTQLISNEVSIAQ